MAAELVTRLTGDDRLTSTLEKAKKALFDLGSNSKRMDDIISKFQRIDASTAPLKKKLRDIKALMAQMNIDGLTDTDAFSIMAQQAGAYADALGDASQAVRQFSDDNLNLNAATDAMSLVASTASVATGAMGLFGIENENVNEAILKVQSSLALLNGVQAIANVLNKDSALMLKLQALATTGASITTTTFSAALTKNAIVEALATAKTKISTIAQTAWNVAKAIGMAMLGNFTGLALLAAAAVVGLTFAIKKDTNAQEEANDKKYEAISVTELFQKKQQEAADAVNTEVGKTIATYKGLQTQFNNLGSDVEKAKWIEQNKNQFQQLGVEITNVADAESFFNKNSSSVIAALQARARAAALYQSYLKALQEEYTLNNTTKIEYSYKKGDENDKKRSRDKANQDLLNKRTAATENRKKIEEDFIEAQKDADKANSSLSTYKPRSRSGSSMGGKNGNSNSNKALLDPSKDDNTLKFAQDMVRQFEDKLSTIPVTATEDIAKAKAELKKWQKEVEVRKLIITPEFNLPEGSLEYAQDMYTKAQDALKSIDLTLISDEDLQLALKQVDDWKKEVERREIRLGIKVEDSQATVDQPEENKRFEKGSLEDKRQSLSNAKSIIEQTKSDLTNNLISVEDAQKAIEYINSLLQSIGLEPLKLEIITDEDGNKTIVDQMEHLKEVAEKDKEAFDALDDTLSGMGGNVSATVEQFAQLANVLSSEKADITEKIGASLAIIGSSLEAMGADGAVAKIGATAAAIGQIILGFATASVQASQLGPFGWLAFVGAGLGAVATMIATISSYADGGIIDGSSFHGDKLLARVNSGEMILNKSQQSNLYRALRSGNIGGGGLNGNVEFKISGSSLKGCLKNYDDKMNKLK